MVRFTMLHMIFVFLDLRNDHFGMQQVNHGVLLRGKAMHITVQKCHASVHAVLYLSLQCYQFHLTPFPNLTP